MEYEDRVTIATPEGVDLELTLAGAGSRFTAAFVDVLIQSALVGALALALLLGAGAVGPALFSVAAFLVWFGYDVLFEVLASGRTPGKRWTGIRVVLVGGHPVTFVPSAIRNILRLVDFLPAFYVVGCVSILVTARNQRLGDLAAGTLVIRDRVEGVAVRRPFPGDLGRPIDSEELARLDASAVTADELAAVRRFLDRRHDLERGARNHLASQLAERLRPKVAGEPPGLTAERFLELVAAAKAGRA